MNKLYNEDCMIVMKNIPDESIDCVVTDCPYHIIGGGTGKNTNTGGILRHKQMVKDRPTKHVNLGGIFNDSDPTTYASQGKLFKHNDILFSEWLPEVYRILKPGTHCYIMINPRNLRELQVECEKVGFIFQQLIVWDKGNVTPNKYYMNAYELILMLRKGKAKNINNINYRNFLWQRTVIGNIRIFR